MLWFLGSILRGWGVVLALAGFLGVLGRPRSPSLPSASLCSASPSPRRSRRPPPSLLARRWAAGCGGWPPRPPLRLGALGGLRAAALSRRCSSARPSRRSRRPPPLAVVGGLRRVGLSPPPVPSVPPPPAFGGGRSASAGCGGPRSCPRFGFSPLSRPRPLVPRGPSLGLSLWGGPPVGPAAPRLWRWPLRFGGLRRAAPGCRAAAVPPRVFRWPPPRGGLRGCRGSWGSMWFAGFALHYRL